jgi:hypothetical protein
MTMLIEKEASAHTYMYNYPPKPDAVLLDATKKNESEVTKVKRQYEEMLEHQAKQYETTIKVNN